MERLFQTVRQPRRIWRCLGKLQRPQISLNGIIANKRTLTKMAQHFRLVNYDHLPWIYPHCVFFVNRLFRIPDVRLRSILAEALNLPTWAAEMVCFGNTPMYPHTSPDPPSPYGRVVPWGKTWDCKTWVWLLAYDWQSAVHAAWQSTRSTRSTRRVGAISWG